MWEFFKDPQLIWVFATGVMAFLIQFAAIIWRISKAEANIHAKIYEVESEHDVDMQKIRSEILELRLKVSEEYLKKDSFRSVFTDIDARLIRLEGKIDSLRSVIK